MGANRDTTSLSALSNWVKNLDTVSVSNLRVGIGTTNPSRLFHVVSNSSTGAIQVSNSTTGINYGIESFTNSAVGNTSNQFGVYSLADGTGTGDHFGMWSEAKGSGAFARGTFGYARGTANANQANRGVQGTAQSTSGKWNQGVYGYTEAVISGTGYNAGIDGFAKGHSGTNFGALGQTNGTGTSNYGGAFYAYGSTGANKFNYGAYGYAWGGDTNIAVYGYAADDVSNTNVGIYGRANTANGSMAGWFKGNVRIEGNLTITGSISKGSGTFKIDHPLDPENKYLVHSFVESPDMMNVYNGNITTDANGMAVVTLPSYFEASNKDFRYQLTPIGQFAQCIVKEEISSNQFVIQTDKPNVKVSWQVTGIRNDPYAKHNRIIPEETKTQEEKGKYLHPEVYGKSASEAIYNGLNDKKNEESLKKVKEAAELEQENP
jgi:hypothetical protein